MRHDGSEGSLISFVPCISLPADPTSLTCCRVLHSCSPQMIRGSSYFWADSASSGGHDMSCTAHCSSGIDRISLAMRDGRGKLPLTPAAAILLGLSMRPFCRTFLSVCFYTVRVVLVQQFWSCNLAPSVNFRVIPSCVRYTRHGHMGGPPITERHC